MKKICVFCGSASGKGENYIKMAQELGDKIVINNFGLVYGGASIGVMGAVADSVLKNNGEVIGVMPKSLVDWEVGHEGLSKFEIVETMHERKEKMYDYSDAFVAIPGGMGTLDELCEIVTWAQLEYHKKPIFLVNFNGFFDGLIAHFKNAVTEGFLKQEHMDLITIVDSNDELFDILDLN